MLCGCGTGRHGLVASLAVLGEWVELRILEGFSILKDSVLLWIRRETLCSSNEDAPVQVAVWLWPLLQMSTGKANPFPPPSLRAALLIVHEESLPGQPSWSHQCQSQDISMACPSFFCVSSVTDPINRRTWVYGRRVENFLSKSKVAFFFFSILGRMKQMQKYEKLYLKQ